MLWPRHDGIAPNIQQQRSTSPMRKSHQSHAHALTATRAPSHVPDAGANECGVRASYTAPAALADQITSSPFIVTCHPAIFRQSVRTSTTASHIVMATSIDDERAAVRLHHGYKMDRADRLAQHLANQTGRKALPTADVPGLLAVQIKTGVVRTVQGRESGCDRQTGRPGTAGTRKYWAAHAAAPPPEPGTADGKHRGRGRSAMR